MGHYWVFMGTKHIFKNKNGKIPSFKFWPSVSRFVSGDTVSSSLSRICEPAPAFYSDFPGISIASSPDGFPRWLSVKEATCQCRRHRRCGFNPWVGKIPWKRKWQPTPVFLLGRVHGQRSPAGCSLWGRRELGVTSRHTSPAACRGAVPTSLSLRKVGPQAPGRRTQWI